MPRSPPLPFLPKTLLLLHPAAMDPLSIAASVAGLLGLGIKLTALLGQISRLSNAPPLCKAVLVEVAAVGSVLRQIQAFLNDQLHAPAERRGMILLEHVATALTGCVMAKDELENILDGLGLVYTTSGLRAFSIAPSGSGGKMTSRSWSSVSRTTNRYSSSFSRYCNATRRYRFRRLSIISPDLWGT